MNNVWSDQQLMAAVQAEQAAIHYKRAAEYYEAGNPELAIHHSLFAATHIDESREQSQQAIEYCFTAMMYDMQEF